MKIRKLRLLTAALCGIILTSCGNNANLPVSDATGTAVTRSESDTADAYSESMENFAEIKSEKTEISETTQKFAEIKAEMPEIYAEIEQKILYDNGENVLTAGEYISGIMNSGILSETDLGFGVRAMQLADIDGNGIPELIAEICTISTIPTAEIIFVSPDGNAEVLHDSSGNKQLELEVPLEPYKSEGKTVWLAEYSMAGVLGSSGGSFFVSVEGNTVKTDTVRNWAYHKDSDFEYHSDYFWRDELISSYEEYESRYKDFLSGMGCLPDPCPARYIYDPVKNEKEIAEELCDLVKRYIDIIPEVYSEIYDNVIYDDEANVLTAGEYIDALVEYSPFAKSYQNGIQLADIDGNGIPEAVIRTAAFPITSYIAVSPQGKAELLYDMEGNSEICGDMLEPYELNGKTVWLTDFYVGGSVAGGGGECFVILDGNTVKTEIIRNYEYVKNLNTFEYIYNYYWDFSDSERKYEVWDSNNWIDDQTSAISEEEYENRYEEFLSGMEESSANYVIDQRYGGASYSVYELPELLANMLKEYYKWEK